jgi:hypothetical protein
LEVKRRTKRSNNLDRNIDALERREDDDKIGLFYLSTRFIPFSYNNTTKRIAEQMYNGSEMSPCAKFAEESISSPRDRFALSSFEAFHGSKLGASLGCAVAIEGDSDGFNEG